MNEVSVAREEAILRQVNEAIGDGVFPGDDAELVRMRCECGRFDCNAYVVIRVGDYERVRQDARRFILVPGHQRAEVEVVVSEHDSWIEVEKIGVAGAVAEALDESEDSGATAG